MIRPVNPSRKPTRALWAAAALALGLLATPGHAQKSMSGGLPTGVQEQTIKQVRLDQQLNAQVPLDLPFRDETGKSVRLGDYFGSKPVMLVLIQYRCTMLCNEEMNILLDSLKKMQFTPGKEFNLLIVSIDPREQPDLAADKKKSYLEAYGRPAAAAGWHYLTGADSSIKPLAQSVGFHYAYDAHTDQYAHPDGVILVTPQGKVSRYFFRLEYPARDMRLGLVEASSNQIGSAIDAIALLCFHYNPTTGKYSLALMKVVRLAGILTVLAMAVGVVVLKQRDRLSRRRLGDAAFLGEG